MSSPSIRSSLLIDCVDSSKEGSRMSRFRTAGKAPAVEVSPGCFATFCCFWFQAVCTRSGRRFAISRSSEGIPSKMCCVMPVDGGIPFDGGVEEWIPSMSEEDGEYENCCDLCCIDTAAPLAQPFLMVELIFLSNSVVLKEGDCDTPLSVDCAACLVLLASFDNPFRTSKKSLAFNFGNSSPKRSFNTLFNFSCCSFDASPWITGSFS
mmetsp:Transcript_2869/g.7880  ORF Transcript_2869/g.7880 Transcript_2869/m.7880 type:complete len:208 (-) Transcript_2869:1318-1941(-)